MSDQSGLPLPTNSSGFVFQAPSVSNPFTTSTTRNGQPFPAFSFGSNEGVSCSSFKTRVSSYQKPVIRGDAIKSIAELSINHEEVDSQMALLNQHLNAMQQQVQARENRYASAVLDLQSNYDCIINEATAKAASIISEAKDYVLASQEEASTVLSSATVEAEKIMHEAKEAMEAWKIEKAFLSNVQTFQPKIKLDVGGNRFTTSLTTLTRSPDSMIGAMFSGRHALPLDEDGYHFIDRDGTHFRHILNFLRSPESFELNLSGPSLKELIRECDFYGLTDLSHHLDAKLGMATIKLQLNILFIKYLYVVLIYEQEWKGRRR